MQVKLSKSTNKGLVMKTLKYSEMLKEVLKLYPREIPCDDAFPINQEEIDWDSLSEILEHIIEDKSVYYEDKNDLFNVLLMSAFLGIIKGFYKKFVRDDKLYKPCGKLPLIDIIDLNETQKEFIDALNDKYWQEYLKERNETVLYDEVTRDELRESLEQEDHSDDSSDILPKDFMD